MENNKPKCSSIDHAKIDAVIFCQICKVYFCDKCENLHSKTFKEHLTTNLLNEKNDISTELCQEKSHIKIEQKNYRKNNRRKR